MNFEQGLEVADEAVFTKAGTRLNHAEIAILQGSWQNRTYEEIAKETSYSVTYLKQTVGPKLWKLLTEALGEKVTKTNFKLALERRWRSTLDTPSVKTRFENQFSEDRQTEQDLENEVQQNQFAIPRTDCQEAINVSEFYGRTEEIAQLKQWILTDRCLQVAILGIGGVGKTALTAKLVQQVQSEFEYVIWRSLGNAPPLETLLAELVAFVSNFQKSKADISRLLHYLCFSRCLLILDNMETILDAKETGHFRDGYSNYDELLRVIGESTHNSCLILTSREKPDAIATYEGEHLKVRSLRLSGSKEAGIGLLHAKGIVGSEEQKQQLCDRYGNNPLAVKIVATSINDLFDGDIEAFVQQDTFIFNGVRRLLNQQFERLPPLEKGIMYWLALNREWTSCGELESDLVSMVSRLNLLEALASLWRRSFIEKRSGSYTQQPVVMEYVIENFIELFCEEIVKEKPELLLNHALIKVTAKEYIRESQIRMVLAPIARRLETTFGSKKNLEDKLHRILVKLQTEFVTNEYGGGNIINLLIQSQIDLTNYDFSNLKIWQADLRRAKLHHVNFQNADLTKSIFAETFGGILSIVFSPDGKLLAMGDTNGEIHLYQTLDWKNFLTCKGHNNWVVSLAFSPDGRRIASSSTDCTVKCWDIITGQCLQFLEGHENEVWSVAFRLDGDILVSGSDDRTVKLWSVCTGQCLRTFQEHTSWVCSVAFSPDGQRVVSGSDDHTIRLWDINTGECLQTFQGHCDGIRSVTVSPDGQMLASGGDDHIVKLWDINTGKYITSFTGHSSAVYSVKFSAKGDILASGSNDSTVKLWNIHANECLKTLYGHSSHIFSVAFSPQDDLLASGSEDQTVKLWSVQTGECLNTLQGYTSQLLSIAFSPDGKKLASGSRDFSVTLWDVNTGQVLQTFQGHSAAVRSVAFDPQGQTLASGSVDQTVKLWDVNTGQVLQTFQGHSAAVWSIAFNPQGTMLANGSDDGTIKLWNVNTGRALQTFQGHNAAIWSIAFNPQGTMLASCSLDGTIKLWNTSTNECEKILEGHTSWVWSIAFSPNGDLIASTSPDGTLRLWSAKTFECLKILPLNTAWLQSIAFSPDSRILASCSHDYTVKLWDVNTGECLESLQGHTARVWSVVFSPDNQILASSGEDETIRLWSVTTRKCLKILKTARPYEQMNIKRVKGLTFATISTLKSLGAVTH
ncbi:NB-ARC domain-containing protein [Nostoc favosum]|uniref:Pentapeptide repeat-containing protein n=1 Tax=Nostoc favosum CHAB5714 TaxID=2780399 RepID=A0ABS8IEE0_9NOSO|nr:NB-ARC domain-containing protein [Nostoc favosum]MCC5602129.1 pentapeptide repeat-containing protein [Nostoc favosum CHAB5714]